MKPISFLPVSKAHTAPYKVHKYFARRPHNVFNHLIQHYSKEGDIVLDVFCGGGVTVYESIKLNRKPIGIDLNPLSIFVSEQQLSQVEDIKKFEMFFEKFLQELKEILDDFYIFNHEEKIYQIVWGEYAYIVICPQCSSEIILIESNKALSEKTNLPKNGFYICPNTACKHNSLMTGIARTKCKPASYVPIRFKVMCDGKNFIVSDGILFDKILDLGYPNIKSPNLKFIYPDDVVPRNWDRNYEDKLYEKGILNFSDLFTQKNYVINVIIFNKIKSLECSKTYKDLLYFIFSSSLRYTNKMVRVTENWEGGNPTAMDKHAYWLPNTFIEQNILTKLVDRKKACISMLNFNKQLPPHKKTENFKDLIEGDDLYYILKNQSSSDLSDIANNSVDVVITDPPYGSNVQYAELSAFWNIWLKSYQDNQELDCLDTTQEAVMHRKAEKTGIKSIGHYQKLLTEIYSECYRVLKNNSYLVFTFNNKDFKVWIAMLKAVKDSGFILPKNGIFFHDYIKSYKNTSHLRFSGNVQGDFIYSFMKSSKVDRSLNNLKTEDVYSIVVGNIEKSINILIKEKESFDTATLYETIFFNVTSLIFDLLDLDDLDLSYFYQDNFLENVLNRNLVFSNGLWSEK